MKNTEIRVSITGRLFQYPKVWRSYYDMKWRAIGHVTINGRIYSFSPTPSGSVKVGNTILYNTRREAREAVANFRHQYIG